MPTTPAHADQSAYNASVLGDGPLGFWDFANGSPDLSGHGRQLRLAHFVITSGPAGPGITTDNGRYQYVVGLPTFTLANLTIEYWERNGTVVEPLKYTDTEACRDEVFQAGWFNTGSYQSPSPTNYFEIDDKAPDCSGTLSGQLSSPGGLDGGWHLCDFTRTAGGRTLFYIDGRVVENIASSDTAVVNEDAGAQSFFPMSSAAGLADLALYGGALSQQQVLNHFNAAAAPPVTGPPTTTTTTTTSTSTTPGTGTTTDPGTTTNPGTTTSPGTTNPGTGSLDHSTGGSNGTTSNGGGNPGLPTTSPCSCDPIDPVSGDYSDSTTDLAMPTGSTPLAMTRSYSSLEAAAGARSPLGQGWSDAWTASLTTVPGGFKVTNTNGSTTVFSQRADGTFAAQAGASATLVENGDGTFTYAIPTTTTTTFQHTGGLSIVSRPEQTLMFSSTGQLQSIADHDGNTVTLAYGSTSSQTAGLPSSATSSFGPSLSFAYNAANLLTKASDSTGRTVTYTYNSAGQLSKVTDARGNATTYSYSTAGLLATETSPAGKVVLRNTYDNSGRVLKQIGATSGTTTYSYVGTTAYPSSSTTEVDPDGNKSVYAIANGRLSTLTRGDGSTVAATWRYQRSASTPALVSEVDAPTGRSATYKYDAAGNVIEAAGDTQQYAATYDGAGDPLTIVRGGVTTSQQFNARGDLVAKTVHPQSGVSATTSYEYNQTGQVVEQQSPNGGQRSFAYNAVGLMTAQTDPLGNKTTFTYTPQGWLSTKTPPLASAALSYTYDAGGHATSIVRKSGTTHYTYDKEGLLHSVTSPTGLVTTYTDDAAGRVLSISSSATTKPLASYKYDQDGLLIDVASSGGTRDSTFTYDALGNMASATRGITSSSQGQRQPYSYDSEGNLLGDGSGTQYGYNDSGQLATVTYAGDASPDVRVSYDSGGNRTSVTDPAGTATYAYDGAGRLTSETTEQNLRLAYSYDLDGNVVQMTYPRGAVVAKTYDADDRLIEVTNNGQDPVMFQYDADSNMTKITDPPSTGETDSFEYGQDDTLNKVTFAGAQSTLASLSYTRGPDGRVTSEQQTGLPGRAATFYSYNALGQLDEADSLSSGATPGQKCPCVGYQSDAQGDLTNLGQAATVNPDGSTTFPGGWSYNESGAATSSPAGPVTYDSSGRNTSQPYGAKTATEDYGVDGRLSRVTLPPGTTGVPGPQTEDFRYDADGLLSKETFAGSYYVAFAWDLTGATPLPLFFNDSYLIYDQAGNAIEQYDHGALKVIHHDQLGSVRMVTDSSGGVLATSTYNAYGGVSGTTGSNTTELGFAGQLTDPYSGLQFDRARWYSGRTGQFLTPDPLQDVTQEPYTYAGANPLNEADPSGELPGFISGAADAIGHAASSAGGYVSSHVGAVVGGASDVLTVAGCAAPITDIGCPVYIGANIAVQGAVIATGPGSTASKIAIIGLSSVALGGGALAADGALEQAGAIEAAGGGKTPAYAKIIINGGSATPAAIYDAVGLSACP